MSVPSAIDRSPPNQRNGGPLASRHVLLPRFAGEGGDKGVCEVLWGDAERFFCRGWRRDDNGHLSAVLLVIQGAANRSPGSLDRLNHELGLKDDLDGAWAVRPLEIVHDGGYRILVLEDDLDGFEPLDRLLASPMAASDFLRLAAGIASAVGKLHRRGLLHKDIKPPNIVVNRTTGAVKLTGFGIASRLPRERQPPGPPDTIAGTLAYMAPEQTGRMNRSIDSRSDLYALGVTFYQMLTGTLPFTASNAMEWMHSHIAKTPVSPAERLNGVPPPVSAIVMKLLAKTPEERYQTAAALEADLRHCLGEMENRQRIEVFPLGVEDVSDRLLIPEQLYGREQAIATLLAALDRVSAGSGPELVLIAGNAGIGKSAVVEELHRALLPRGLFAFGKFDQYQREIPYASLAQALQGLIRQLLGKREAELAPWRTALATALGLHGRLMVTLVPELELLVGQQPPVPELPLKDAQRRFHLVVRRLLNVFARPEHPLVLFLDDLQWLDGGTLDLLEDLQTQTDLRHLLLIGAYRNDDVTPAHPLIRRMAAIRQAGGQLNEVVLMPLGTEDVGRMVADALHCSVDRAKPLARLVHKRTAGNPFFAVQFLSALFEEGLVRFDHGSLRWAWDVRRIRAKGHTDNVVDLMVGKLRRLPAETQAALTGMACLGTGAAVATLTLVRGGNEEALHAAVSPAVRAGLVLRQHGTYRFLHDRIQEAAYALMPEGERAAAHLAMGRLLFAQPNAVEKDIFEIVGHLNRGATLIASAEERNRLAELNLVAGRLAKSAAAYASGLAYVSAGAALLSDDAWERWYELAFALELLGAECEFLTGALVESGSRLAELARRATSVTDLASITRLRVDLFMTLGRSDRAVAAGLDYLRRARIDWPAHPTKAQVRREYARMWRQLGDRPIEGLVDLVPMTDPVALATVGVLAALVTPALFTDENLRCLVIGRMANVSLQHGNNDIAPYAYCAVGNVLGPYFGDYKRGFRFAELGLDLVERPGMDRLKARVYLAFGNLAKPAQRRLPPSRPLAQYAFETAQQAGDLTYAAFSCNNMLTQLLADGSHLAEVQREADLRLDFARQARFSVVVECITGQRQLIRTLRGLTPVFGCFDDAEFREDRFERSLEDVPGLAVAGWLYWIRKLQASVLAGDYRAALAAATKAERLLWVSPAIFERADYHFYAALALAAQYHAAPAAERSQCQKVLKAHRRQLDEWAEHCPENFASRAALVAAEAARLANRVFDAERLYEEAVQSARANALRHIEAIAYERASAFYQARGFEEFAALYLQSARRCYMLWGADGKVRQLDEFSPHLREDERHASPTSTIEAPVEQFDLAAVMRSSQAISGEIVTENLIDTLLRIGVEQAGAERGLLIMLHGGEPRIVAEAITRGDHIDIQSRDEVPSATTLPESVLHYVLRTQEAVSLNDALAEHQFAADPYIRHRLARSILCLPMTNQAKPIGVLYLENNLAPGVFVPARAAVLRLLASQAAIALEIARLHGDLAEREARIRRLVEANLIAMFIGNRDGRIVSANDAFLSMVGYDQDDLAGGRLCWTDLTAPEWHDRAKEAVAELDSIGRARPFELEYQRKDGSRLPVLIGAATFDDGSNQGVAFVLDLTDRKRAEKELRANAESLRRSEAYLAAAQRLSYTGTWVFSATATLYWSEESYRIWGLDPMQGLPDRETLLQRIHPEDRDRVDREARDATDRNRVYSVEFRIVLPDGTVRYLQSTGRPFFSTEGELVEIVGTDVDVTERRHAQDERERVRQLESDLAHVNRVSVLGEMTATLAHEILHPIATARNNARAATRFLDVSPPDLGEVREALDCVVRDADRAAEIVGRIRAHLKKAPPRSDRFDINEAISEVILMAQNAIDKHGVSVQLRLTDRLLPVRGDRVQLQQVALNLVLNAVEAMSAVQEGARNLAISTERTDDRHVIVAVRDSGPGIDSVQIEKVFEPFYTTKANGVGMGLSICRSIVIAHGGRLWAEPNQPRGALFQFMLPPDHGDS